MQMWHSTPDVCRSPALSPGTHPASSEQLLGLFLPLGDFGERHSHSGPAQRFDQRGVLGIEGANGLDDRRIRTLCMCGELLNSFR